ncbi:Rieske (2Fe-2S) protein [Pontibacter sp. 172403-2]|uniref:QcrA and Rieske domain-containing protein n=1 Tax=Pontibacter rufus TaxID=2791028 RepID=UPI0018AF6858|nr:Rieske (2Fe-2S) protein [Pontibacter sp. 172403-2]MBF9254043.1 Rieske (2Fe-2S) protein [Pontibacter sp. 172403-2]
MKQRETGTEEDRRRFLMKLSLGLGGLAAAAAGIPVLGALLAPLLEKTGQTWRTVGTLRDFEIGTTSLIKYENPNPQAWAGVTAHSAAWLRRDSEKEFLAFSVNCTHLGCPVRWEQKADLFMCPCHGGVYYRDGTVAAGPPPNSLPQYAVRVKSGQVQIRTAPIPITNITA